MCKSDRLLDELKRELPGGTPADSPGGLHVAASTGVKVTPVEIVGGQDQRLRFMQGVLAPALGPLGTAALVLILVVFMLLEREELRNRIIRLIGQGRISTTAHAMDDAGARVSKYLLMQLVVNVTYGIPVAAGLYFIGVPNAMLWGVLATVLRFIPYLGPWIAAAFPIGLSLATAPGWMAPLLTPSWPKQSNGWSTQPPLPVPDRARRRFPWSNPPRMPRPQRGSPDFNPHGIANPDNGL